MTCCRQDNETADAVKLTTGSGSGDLRDGLALPITEMRRTECKRNASPHARTNNPDLRQQQQCA